MKTCTVCKIEKTLEAFEKGRNKCRKCRSEKLKNKLSTPDKDKTCNVCGIFKEAVDFEGVRMTCRKCRSDYSINASRTKHGHIKKLYNNQKRASRERGHPHPTYTLAELEDWLMSQTEFHVLYDNWKRLDYDKWYAPSVDRKDDNIGYTMLNIQLMTWKMNCNKAHKDSMTHKLTTGKKKIPVDMYSLDGDFIKSFVSIREASRYVNKNCRREIIKCCKGIHHTCAGFTWKYADGGGI